MTLNRVLRARLNQTITVNAFASRNLVGDPTYSTSATTYTAREEQRHHQTVGPDGRDVLSRGLIYVGLSSTGGTPSIKVNDKVTAPDNTIRPLVNVETLRDRTGIHHQILHYGSVMNR
jgi:hypothetical protein